VYFQSPTLVHGLPPSPTLSEISTRPSCIEAPKTLLASACSAPLNSLLAITKSSLKTGRMKRASFADAALQNVRTLSK
jgi:hypothetical protein